jgi:hypothetical protein
MQTADAADSGGDAVFAARWLAVADAVAGLSASNNSAALALLLVCNGDGSMIIHRTIHYGFQVGAGFRVNDSFYSAIIEQILCNVKGL